MERPDGSNNYIVGPVHKALEVLKHVAEEQRELSLTEITRRVGLPKTTVFRYLYTLCECGLIAHDPDTDLYRLGLYAWELGRLAVPELHLREVALPFMAELRALFDETVNLGVMDGKEFVYIEMAESQRALRWQARLGSRDPLYCTAIGKAILAFTPEDQWHARLPSRLQARTVHTLTSHSALKEDLLRTRQRGYSQDREENEEGAWCIGAPIFDERRRVSAGLSVSMPASRLNDELAQKIAAAVIKTANSISWKLGYRSDAH